MGEESGRQTLRQHDVERGAVAGVRGAVRGAAARVTCRHESEGSTY